MCGRLHDQGRRSALSDPEQIDKYTTTGTRLHGTSRRRARGLGTVSANKIADQVVQPAPSSSPKITRWRAWHRQWKAFNDRRTKMGEKSVEFQTSASVKECGQRFQSGIVNGRGLSSKFGGLTAKLLGVRVSAGTRQGMTPRSQRASNDDPPAFSVGVGVPKAQGAHQHGTHVQMYVWDRGNHRDVMLAAHHSLAGGAHANQSIQAVTSKFER